MRIKKLKHGFQGLNKQKARVIAHLVGDGCVYKVKSNYWIRYEVKDNYLVDSFAKDIISVYGLPVTRGLNESGKKPGNFIPFVCIRSKLAFEDLKKYCEFSSAKWFVPNRILEAEATIKVEFLKALFDDEGTVITNRNKEVRLYSTNFKGITQIQKMLIELGIVSRITSGYGSKRNVYGLIVRDLRKFHNTIGFNLARKQEKLKSLL